MNEFGKLVSVVGPVADVWFEHAAAAASAALCTCPIKTNPCRWRLCPIRADGRVRCIALGATPRSMYVGQPVEDTGGRRSAFRSAKPSIWPASPSTPWANRLTAKGPIQAERHSIHQAPPPLAEQTPCHADV